MTGEKNQECPWRRNRLEAYLDGGEAGYSVLARNPVTSVL